jgi:opacity protein-like surface antigen
MSTKSFGFTTLAAIMIISAAASSASAQSADTSRWSVSFGAGMAPSISGIYHEAGTGAVLRLATQVQERDWSEIYGSGFTMSAGAGFALTNRAEVAGAFRYSRRDANELSVGDVASLDLQSVFGDYRDWGLEGGLRWHFAPDARVGPYIGVAAGMRRIEAMPATFTVPAAGVVLAGTRFYGESTVPTFAETSECGLP